MSELSENACDSGKFQDEDAACMISEMVRYGGCTSSSAPDGPASCLSLLLQGRELAPWSPSPVLTRPHDCPEQRFVREGEWLP